MPQTVESLKPPKRFYQGVSVAATREGFAIQLDARTPRTPGGRSLILPNVGLAQLVAGEWSAQESEVVFASMPATRLAHTAIDSVSGSRDEVASMITDIASADGLCYLADGPARLVHRQATEWIPLIDWARNTMGLRFDRGVGLLHSGQPPATLTAVKALAIAFDDFTLAALGLAAQTLGSAILAFALMRGRLDGATAVAAAQLEEIFQAAEWGEDSEAATRRRSALDEAAMLEAWFAALRPV